MRLTSKPRSLCQYRGVATRSQLGEYNLIGTRSQLDQLEKKYDCQFKIVVDAIRQLMAPPKSKPKQIGFRPKALKK